MIYVNMSVHIISLFKTFPWLLPSSFGIKVKAMKCVPPVLILSLTSSFPQSLTSIHWRCSSGDVPLTVQVSFCLRTFALGISSASNILSPTICKTCSPIMFRFLLKCHLLFQGFSYHLLKTATTSFLALYFFAGVVDFITLAHRALPYSQ